MFKLAVFQNIGFSELLVILFIILLLFGSTKIPSLMRSLGKGLSEFKKGMNEGKEDEAGVHSAQGADKQDSAKPS